MSAIKSMNYLPTFLWLILAALCAIMAITKAPAQPPKPNPVYHVAYNFRTGNGCITVNFAGPLTESRMKELSALIAKDLIEKHAIDNPSVVVTVVIPLEQP